METEGIILRSSRKLIVELLEKESFEAVSELAKTFPTMVFPDAVGLGESDRRRLVDYDEMVFSAIGPDNELRRNSMAKGLEAVPWITEECQRGHLKPEGFRATIYGAADEVEITEEEAGMLVRSLPSAEVDTTATAFIGSAIWCLARNAEQFQQLKADLKLARWTFEETLRYNHWFIHSAARLMWIRKYAGLKSSKERRFSAPWVQRISTKTTGRRLISPI